MAEAETNLEPVKEPEPEVQDVEGAEGAEDELLVKPKVKKKKKMGFDSIMVDADETAALEEPAGAGAAAGDEGSDDEPSLLVKKKKKKKVDLSALTGDAAPPSRALEPGLVIAEVGECAPHPMADKLTVCTVDYGGSDTARVVCSAPNVKAGLKVIFARVGVVIPSTGEKLVKTPLRGVMSEGMILSAAEMGWMDKAVGIIECPKKSTVGDPAPTEPPPDLALADPAAKKRRSKDKDKEGKGDKKEKSSKKDKEPEGEPKHEEEPEPEPEPELLLGKKEKKGKVAFNPELEEALEPEPEPEPEPVQEPAAAADRKKKKKKGGAKEVDDKAGDDDLDALFAELGIDASAVEPAGESKAAKKRREKKERETAAAAAVEGAEGAEDVGGGGAAAEGATTPAAAAVAAAAAASTPGEGEGEGESLWEKQLEELEALQASGEKLNDPQKNKLKKLKKKAKEKEAKGGAGAGADAPGKAGGPKPSAAVLKMQETVRLREEAAAVAAAAEAERAAIEKAEEEAEATKQAEVEVRKAAKREKERLKKEQLKKDGKLLSSKQKEEQRRLEAMRAQILQRADGSSSSLLDEDGEPAAFATRVLVDDRKKKKEAFERKRQEDETAKRVAEEEVAAEAAAEEVAVEAAEATKVAAEEAAAAAAAEDSDDVEDDWDAVANLDDLVKIPNKVEEERRAKQEQQMAEEEEAKAKAQEEEARAEEEVDRKAKDTAAAGAGGKAAGKTGAAKGVGAAAAGKATAGKPWAVAAKAKAGAKASAAAAKAAPNGGNDNTGSGSGSDDDDNTGSGSGSGSGSESGSDSNSNSDSDSESDSDSDSSEYSSSEYDSDDERQRVHYEKMQAAKTARLARFDAAKVHRSRDRLRCPIICILGHVDTGKTKILDNIRRTNVQDGEAGGITQQIGATFIPDTAIHDRTKQLTKGILDLNIPGLLVIDTPGHESFTNLRTRGSSLCDLAILVVDIMHGLEPQTLESLNMLRLRKTPFIIALNKIDRMFDWKSNDDFPTRETLDLQKAHAKSEFEDRAKKVMLEFANEGLNAAIYWDNPDPRKFINVVPTSAITGEGIPDMIYTLVDLTQTRMNERLQFFNAVQCTVLEVKMIEGLGTTMDVILINGTLREGQTIVVAGLHGAIVTTIRALLTPQPLREMRIKANYQHHKEISAAMGIKICAVGLEQAVAGTAMLVQEPEDDLEELKEEVLSDMKGVMSRIDKSGEGVYVQASTLGSLEALLEFLKSDKVKIPVAGIAIGPVNKRDVMGASVMHERKRPEFATILAFDVKVSDEAQKMANDLHVKIFTADIIYHLFDQFTAYMEEVKTKKKAAAAERVSFPCVLKIMPNCIFNKRDPIVVGVDIVKGIARIGTQLCIPSQGFIDIGKIASMELNHKQVDKALPGQSVAMKIQAVSSQESSRLYGRHFDHKDELVSRITRESIDMLKENFRDELGKEDWRLVVELKKKFEIHYGEPM
uniref:Eukaryotic translation initiation factor 5B n=1 Tax=Mantoniella antarctica TaxID=81844 RepID=A0A7S0SPN1_9CHLO